MPVSWPCAGWPNCTRYFLHAAGLKAHELVCPLAKSFIIEKSGDLKDISTIADTVLLCDDPTLGNVQVSRKDTIHYRLRSIQKIENAKLFPDQYENIDVISKEPEDMICSQIIEQ